MLHRMKSFFGMQQARRRLFFEALFELCRAWLLVRLLPFRKYSDRLGRPYQGEYSVPCSHDPELLKDIRWALKKVNRLSGGRFTCLMLGMAGKVMLNRRNLQNTLVLGAMMSRDKPASAGSDMAAHAWLWAGDKILLGGAERHGFLPVTSYHSA